MSTEKKKTTKHHLVWFALRVAHELEHARVCHDRNQPQAVRQDLVVYDGRVHVHVHVFDGHRRYLEKNILKKQRKKKEKNIERKRKKRNNVVVIK